MGFAYGSLASGADILVAEAVLDAGIRLEIVLPFDTDEFETVSVAPAGERWAERFRSCLARARVSGARASDSSFMHDEELFGYAARIAIGHALNRAAFLDAPVEQLAVWDGDSSNGIAGTAHDVAIWGAAGHPTHVISLPASGRAAARCVIEQVRARPRDRHDRFHRSARVQSSPRRAVFDVREQGARRARRRDRPACDAVRWVNTWGDAIAAVFSDVTAAADCALGFHEALQRVDLEAIGLPADLDLRIGAHAGPVIAIVDPVSHKPTYWGRELTRAARIEPRTPEGEVYVTDTFAALLVLEPGAAFATEYVGRVTTAKDFETIPMYRLQRRERWSSARAGLDRRGR